MGEVKTGRFLSLGARAGPLQMGPRSIFFHHHITPLGLVNTNLSDTEEVSSILARTALTRDRSSSDRFFQTLG